MDDSPETSDMKMKKRKRRAVLSCNDCRRRKLKCDRELPCNRCVQGGIAAACAYGLEYVSAEEETRPRPNVVQNIAPRSDRALHTLATIAVGDSDAIKGSPPEVHHQDRIDQLQTRIAQLETQLTLPSHVRFRNQNETEHETEVTEDDQYHTALIGLFKGRNYRTFSYGPTSPVTIVVNFPELRPFMKSIYPDSTLERLSGDIKDLENRARVAGPVSRVLSISSLRSLLPDRLTVDLLVQRYIETFETTYRIIHIPSFQADYKRFWSGEADAESAGQLEAVLLGILACVLCTSTHESTKYDPNGSTFRSKAIIWIKACDAWLKRQSNKHRTLAALQVRCLRLLALKTTCFKTKEFYQEVQAHFGFMKACGMHRDPIVIGSRCTAFEAEMRRRLWATTVELELQSSIDRGIASTLSGLDHDCTAPRNINDSDLHVDCHELPPSQPISVFTDSSFVHLSTQSVALRTNLCKIANSLQPIPDFPETLRLEQEVAAALSSIPRWTDRRSLQAWTHLDLALRQFLDILHMPRAFRTNLRAHPNHRYSILTCLDASVTLIERHMELMESGNFALCCIRSDYYRAALIISHIAYHASRASDDFILRVAKSGYDDIMEKALRLQQERSMRPGRGNHQYWYVSAAYSLARTQFNPDRAEIYKRQASDRVSKMLYKILSLQDEPGVTSMAHEVILTDDNTIPTRTNDGIASAGPVLQNTFADNGLGFDFGGSSEWMLDDFWLFNNDFPQIPFGN